MAYKINCPACRQPLYLPQKTNGDEEIWEILCQGCQRKYAVSYLDVESSTSSLEPLPSLKPEQPLQYRFCPVAPGRGRAGTS